MPADLQDPIFTDETAARETLEAIRWPNGPVCPHCGSLERIAKVEGTKKAHRDGLYYCNDCKGQFTVTVGSVFERSHVPLTKWWLATYLLGSSKKGISSHQLHRMLGVTYKTAWFMSHRIREAMRDGSLGPLGGQNKVVEIDETYVGGKEANKHAWKRTPGRQGGKGKAPVLSLVERGGKVRSFHVPVVTGQLLKPIIVEHVNKASYLMTDGNPIYPGIGTDFAGHGTVNHSAEEYVRAYFWHTNTGRKFFLDLQAWCDRHLPLDKRGALGSVCRRVRFPLQPSLWPWLYRPPTCGCSHARHRREAFDLSADSRRGADISSSAVRVMHPLGWRSFLVPLSKVGVRSAFAENKESRPTGA